MRALVRALPLAALVVLVGGCGGDDDQEAESVSLDSRSSETTVADDADDAGDAEGTNDDVGLRDVTECTDSSTDDPDAPDSPGAPGPPDIEIDDGGISIGGHEGDGVHIDEDGLEVDTGEGQISIDGSGISIEGCFGDIDVDADDDGITISGPDGEVTISPDDAVAELGGEDTPEGISIPLADSVLFDFDSAALRPESGQQLSLVAGLTATYSDATIEIGGHTDAVGDEAYNQQLSDARARAVRDALSVLGVRDDRISATGYGETQPVAPETTPDGADDPAGRQRNRRVEILLLGADL